MSDDDKKIKYKEDANMPLIEFRPVIDLNCGCHDKKKNKCECKGFVDSDNIVANICPNCKFAGSTITVPVYEFLATSINPPICEFTPQGSILVTGGSGVMGNAFGVYTLGLFETLSGPDIAHFTFSGTSPGGGFTFASTAVIVDDENLSVTQCHEKHSGPSSHPLTTKLKNMLNDTMKKAAKGFARKTIIHPDGRVEEIDFMNKDQM
ncbi:hypothetical protein J2Y03_000687 [Neobacillus niacini]|uniref:hypothetical protein n=1 Tax=Neobacillus niacini TaxID=86668 RepID=UPI00285FD057|nr:hypothetical protein [Neobacillus niacini]MDR7075699.1 hypothetical protein [Neobacillus niacini]